MFQFESYFGCQFKAASVPPAKRVKAFRSEIKECVANNLRNSEKQFFA